MSPASLPSVAGMTGGRPISAAPKVQSFNCSLSGRKRASPALATPPPRIITSGRKMVMNEEMPAARWAI